MMTGGVENLQEKKQVFNNLSQPNRLHWPYENI